MALIHTLPCIAKSCGISVAYRYPVINQSINQIIFIVPLKVYRRAGQICLPHIEMTKTEKNKTKI